MIDLETYLLSSLWWCITIWIVLYVIDYYLTIWGAQLYVKGANTHIVIEGSYELTPVFQKDIDHLRIFSLRFFGYTVLSVAIISALWYIAHRYSEGQTLFLLAYGGLVFRQLVVLVRHARNITLFRRLKEHKGVDGCVRYSKWLTLEQSWIELVFMALLLLAAAMFAAKATLFGGAFATFVTGLEHRTMARKAALGMNKDQGAQIGP